MKPELHDITIEELNELMGLGITVEIHEIRLSTPVATISPVFFVSLN